MTTWSGPGGSRDPAERVAARARDHGLPLDADPALLKLLVRVDRVEDMPPHLYAVAAHVLDFAWSVADECAAPSPPGR